MTMTGCQLAACARVRLKHDLVKHLARDFRSHGESAIAKLRTQKPIDYLRLVTAELDSEAAADALRAISQSRVIELPERSDTDGGQQ